MDQKNDDFLRTPISYGVILRGDIPDIRDLKEHLAELSEIEVIYQTTDAGKLYIKRGGEGESDE